MILAGVLNIQSLTKSIGGSDFQPQRSGVASSSDRYDSAEADPPPPLRQVQGLASAELSDVEECWEGTWVAPSGAGPGKSCGWKLPQAPSARLLFQTDRASPAVLAFLRGTKAGRMIGVTPPEEEDEGEEKEEEEEGGLGPP